jgi:hypothetical protein
MCIGTIFVASALTAAVSAPVAGHTRRGNLDARAHLQAVHAEMQHECGAAPCSPRCHQLKREFRQETRNYRRRHGN